MIPAQVTVKDAAAEIAAVALLRRSPAFISLYKLVISLYKLVISEL